MRKVFLFAFISVVFNNLPTLYSQEITQTLEIENLRSTKGFSDVKSEKNKEHHNVYKNRNISVTLKDKPNEKNISVTCSKDDKIDDSDLNVKFNYYESSGDIVLDTRCIDDRNYYIINYTTSGVLKESKEIDIQVRDSFAWNKISLGAALAYYRKDKENYLLPSPLLYSSLVWSYPSTLKNYLMPRSIGFFLNPTFLESMNDPNSKNLLPLLTTGIGIGLLDNYLVAGIAYDFGLKKPKGIIAFNAFLFK